MTQLVGGKVAMPPELPRTRRTDAFSALHATNCVTASRMVVSLLVA